jgi:hypothetical protein
MSNLYRWPSNDASYQASIHLAKRFQRRRFFRNRLIRNKNCLWSILERSSIKIAHLVPIRYQTCPPQTILVSDWLISKKLSLLKPLGQINRNSVGSIPGKSFMLPTKFRFIWPSGFRGEYFFRNQPIRNKNCLWRPCLLTDSGRNEQSL